MEAASPGRPRVGAGSDRTAVLVFVILEWIAVVSGFGTNSYHNLTTYGLGYYHWIVHIHAVVFVSWMVLFTTQVLLIRRSRPDLHRKLGFAMLGWMCLMAIVGPATAIVRDGQKFAATGAPPIMLSVQFTDILALVTLTVAGALMRKRAAAHKRLMLLALAYVTDAGFARFINPLLALPLPGDPLTHPATLAILLYGGTNLLVLAIGIYDLARYRRLHPAWIAGTAWILLLQIAATELLLSPAWAEFSLRFIGR